MIPSSSKALLFWKWKTMKKLMWDHRTLPYTIFVISSFSRKMRTYILPVTAMKKKKKQSQGRWPINKPREHSLQRVVVITEKGWSTAAGKRELRVGRAAGRGLFEISRQPWKLPESPEAAASRPVQGAGGWSEWAPWWLWGKTHSLERRWRGRKCHVRVCVLERYGFAGVQL